MKKFLRVFRTVFPTKVSPFGWFIMFLQFFYLYQVASKNDMGGVSFAMESWLRVALSMFTVWLYFQIIGTITSRQRWIMVVCTLLFGLGLYDLLVAYQFQAQELFNWSVLTANGGEAFSKESWDVIISSLNPDALLYWPVISVVFLVFELWKKAISKGRQAKPLAIKVIAALLIYASLVLAPIDSYDPVLNFFRSMVNAAFPRVPLKLDRRHLVYPLKNDGVQFHSGPYSHGRQPHVFLIMVESLNASAIGAKSPEGRELTPFLNQLKERSVYVEQFYGNSIQTAKGHFATYFSVIPSLTGKEFVKYPATRLKSLATELKETGYNTAYFIAHDNLNFDNEYNFLTRHGFEKFASAAQNLTPDESAKALTWGVEDAVFYKKFFEWYDQNLRPQAVAQPQFVTLVTIANHFPFDSVPESARTVYPDVKKVSGIVNRFRANYANSVRLCDTGIQAFFEGLKARGLDQNSIVVITGDHAFPMGEHGNFHLEAGYNEESFRIPLFIVWPERLAPRHMPGPFSQMDIAPTIVDLTDSYIGENNFQGQSLFRPDPQKAVLLVQPYGKHLCVVKWPFKYRYLDKTGQEFVYNLQTDPKETKNIQSRMSDAQMAYFREQLRRIYENQLAIQYNLFW